MQTEQQNYGVEESPGTVAEDQNERAWSVISHLSVFLNVFTVVLGPVASLVIWFVYKDRSQKIAFQALQSTAYQAAWLVLLAAGWTVTFALMAVLVGFLLVPAMLILTAFPFVHSAYAAYKVAQGEDYRYPLIADLIQAR